MITPTEDHPVAPFLRMDRIPHIWCPTCGIGIAVKCFAQALEKEDPKPFDNYIIVQETTRLDKPTAPLLKQRFGTPEQPDGPPICARGEKPQPQPADACAGRNASCSGETGPPECWFTTTMEPAGVVCRLGEAWDSVFCRLTCGLAPETMPPSAVSAPWPTTPPGGGV